MKKLCFILLIAGVSCNGKADEPVRETPVDSTNVNGTAPVRYRADNPADTETRYSGDSDSGRPANTSTKENR